jgi:hypothetical protein
MFAQLVSTYHLHQIVNHFIIALLNLRDRRGNLLPPRRSASRGRAAFASAWPALI